MKWIKRIFLVVIVIFFSGFLVYFLPDRDIVQVVGTDVKRMDIGHAPWGWDRPDANTQSQSTRDVRFVNAVWADGKARVYRNEDTNWSFPPYFKFDSGDLSAKAQSLSKSNDEIWVAVTHYGWRIKLLSMFPNAVRVRVVDGPNAMLIPWFNIVFLSLLAFIFISIFRMMRRFKKRRIDPITDKIGDVAEDAGEEITKGGNAISKFFRRWFGTTKKK